MKRETRVHYGAVPHGLADAELAETSWQMDGDRFLLRGEGDHYFYYEKGHGITVERGGRVDVSEESLWLNGSVYSAIASINGLFPFHASAIAFDGAVFAFTGPAGAGKSTLVAALGQQGLPMFCDDTLVLDLSDADRVICLPGHKRLKLGEKALSLTGAERQEPVSSTVAKYYAAPASGEVSEALPLAQLIFLQTGDQLAIEPIAGAERMARLQDDHYMAQLHSAAGKLDRMGQFELLARIAHQVRMARFIRPLDDRHFHEGIARVAEYVTCSAEQDKR